MLDSTMIRAHQQAAGTRKNIETATQEQELGRSKGGWFTSKLQRHATPLEIKSDSF